MKTQEIATRCLILIEKSGISPKEAINMIMKSIGIDDVNIRKAVHAYVYETIKRLNLIDLIIKRLYKGDFSKLDSYTKNLLRVAIYEMKFKNEKPALVTDNAVKIIKSISEKRANLVHAILRNVEKINIKSLLNEIKRNDGIIEYLSYKYFYPSWFVEYVIKLLGKEQAEKFLEASNKEQRYYVRVNTLKTSLENLERYFDRNNVEYEETPLPDVLKIIKYEKPLSRLDWYNKKFVIQDLASCYVAHVLNPDTDDVVLDMAAAPGSKTSHLAMLMENRGKIYAVDISYSRLQKMRLRLKQLGVENVIYILGDSRKVFLKEEYFDKILLDPPCSSTGSIRQFPNVKWNINLNKIRTLTKLQRKMLKVAHKYLKDGGVMTYSTCSILFEENEEIISDFMKMFKIETIERKIGTRGIRKFGRKTFPAWNKVIRTFPHIDDCTGFFLAKLKKN